MNNIKLDSISPVFIKEDCKQNRLGVVATFAVPGLVVVGLLFLLVSLQGGLETGVSNLARLLPIGFAVAAGMVATVNPCGILMLPSYALYQMGSAEAGTSTTRRVLRALLISAVSTLAFVTVFAIVGAIITAGGRQLTRIFPFAGLLIGIGMAALGVYLLVTHKTLGIAAASRVKVNRKRTLGNAFGFGITYAVGSLSCTLPIFLVVVGNALASDSPLTAFGQFIGYALGMGVVLVATIVGSALFQQAVSTWLNRLTPYVHRLSAMFLIGSGAYLIYYWVFIARLSAGA
jgi:cytochrome c biogenesis protein CcdA